jgi:hypothetical protein
MVNPMQERINKPLVFLSHSSKDKDFIEKRLAQDLRKCQIDYWIDTEEIRDGRSWLKMVFQDGIPACDVVIVYLTENSIKSAMVEKEMDATVIEQLSDSGIVLLPYVSKASLRGKLRADIRSLHCREWNEDNYHEVLPSVVSEIWHSYLEKVVSMAVTQEKNKRLEIELEHRKLQEQHQRSPFSPSEEADFRHIYNRLNVQGQANIMPVEIGGLFPQTGLAPVSKVKFNILEMFLYSLEMGNLNFEQNSFRREVCNFLATHAVCNGLDEPYMDEDFNRILRIELPSYGLVKVEEPLLMNSSYVPTDKMYRFIYWLDYHSLLNHEVTYEHLSV